jgi:hypothetical protein
VREGMGVQMQTEGNAVTLAMIARNVMRSLGSSRLPAAKIPKKLPIILMEMKTTTLKMYKFL